MLDGDIFCYRCAAVTEDAEETVARWQVDEMIQRVLKETEADSYQIYLSGENNFRKTLYPEYKANRAKLVKPKWLEQLRSHLVTEWNATITDGYEADDALGMDQDNGYPFFDIPPEVFQTVICSIDKDLLMIPGNHYNFVKQVWTVQQPTEAMLNFYTSVLVGDAVDNIKGCPGIGKAKAPRLLEGCSTERELYEACLAAYEAAFESHTEGERNCQLNAKLLWIWRTMDGTWIPPQKVETK